MSVQSSIDDATTSIMSALAGHNLSDSDKEKISEIVSKLLVDTVEETTKNNLETTTNCCGTELDLAHQIREEIDRKTKLLISNLKAMR